MNENADCVTVGCVRIRSIDISFEQFGVVAFDILRSDDDLDLSGARSTVWLAN